MPIPRLGSSSPLVEQSPTYLPSIFTQASDSSAIAASRPSIRQTTSPAGRRKRRPGTSVKLTSLPVPPLLAMVEISSRARTLERLSP